METDLLLQFYSSPWQMPALLVGVGVAFWFIGQLLSERIWGGVWGLLAIASCCWGVLTLLIRGYPLSALTGSAALGLSILLSFILKFKPRKAVGQGPYAELVGEYGICVTPLNPKGTIEIAGRRVAVTTEGLFVAQGRQVKVVRAKDNVVVVEASSK